MENLSKLFNSLDGNIVEYCILGGIIVLVVILIISIISCVKSLGEKSVSKSKKKNTKVYEEVKEDKFDKDYIAELINVAEDIKKNEDEILVEEAKIAEKIEIPEVIEENTEMIIDESPVKVAQKLDIKSITREMELKLEEEDINEIEAYEDEQEKTAIISYKELLQAASKIEEKALLEEKLDDVDVDLDVVFEFNSKKIIEQEQDTEFKNDFSGELVKFKPTIDISPVFGPLRSDRYKSQEELLKIEEVELDDSTDIGEKEEFLKNLQDFRSNLD